MTANTIACRIVANIYTERLGRGTLISTYGADI